MYSQFSVIWQRNDKLYTIFNLDCYLLHIILLLYDYEILLFDVIYLYVLAILSHTYQYTCTCFVCLADIFRRIFSSYGIVTIVGEGLKIWTYTRRSWPMGSRFATPTATWDIHYYGNLLPSVWHRILHYVLPSKFELRSLACEANRTTVVVQGPQKYR